MAEKEALKVDYSHPEAPKGADFKFTGKHDAPTKQPEETRKYDFTFPQVHELKTEEHKKALGKLEEKK